MARKPYKYYTRFCKDCGEIFRTKGKYARMCEDCLPEHGWKGKNLIVNIEGVGT